ncbi:hypothetical protein KCU78_g14869, partial [Aureobasidium melanogenum]
MLLTLSQPGKSDFGARSTHDFKSPPLPRYSPKSVMNDAVRPPLPASITPTMSNQHRGLPPPAAMTLPDPGRAPPMIPPPPPPAPVQAPAHIHHEAQRAQWQDEGESSRSWHATRVEEERRRQEEEKTRQESLRLEQRRVEHSMLRESMQGGIPPHMVPMIFAGIGGANLANFSLEVLQQYTAQLQAAQQQVQAGQEDARERRSINQPPAPYALPSQPQSQAHAGAMPQQPPPPLAAHQTTFSAFQSTSPPGRRGPAAPRPSVAQSTLPRLTTGDMQINPPPSAPSSAHPLHQTQTIHQDQPASSLSIYFHHWVPPTSQADSKSGNQPHTPVTGTGASQNSEGHHADSPRKRKNQQAHQPPPAPSSFPAQSHSSPSFSTTSSGRKGGPAQDLARSNASPRAISGAGQTSNRRDSGAPGTHLDFVYERGIPPSKSQHHHPSHHSTAPPSPKRDARHPY